MVPWITQRLYTSMHHSQMQRPALKEGFVLPSDLCSPSSPALCAANCCTRSTRSACSTKQVICGMPPWRER